MVGGTFFISSVWSERNDCWYLCWVFVGSLCFLCFFCLCAFVCICVLLWVCMCVCVCFCRCYCCAFLFFWGFVFFGYCVFCVFRDFFVTFSWVFLSISCFVCFLWVSYLLLQRFLILHSLDSDFFLFFAFLCFFGCFFYFKRCAVREVFVCFVFVLGVVFVLFHRFLLLKFSSSDASIDEMQLIDVVDTTLNGTTIAMFYYKILHNPSSTLIRTTLDYTITHQLHATAYYTTVHFTALSYIILENDKKKCSTNAVILLYILQYKCTHSAAHETTHNTNTL